MGRTCLIFEIIIFLLKNSKYSRGEFANTQDLGYNVAMWGSSSLPPVQKTEVEIFALFV